MERDEENRLSETQAGEAPQAKPRPRKNLWKRYRWLLWLLLMVPVVYFAVQVVIVLAPQVQTEVALQDTMTDSVTVQGEVVLSNVPITGTGGKLYYTVPKGQRVAAGTEVAQVYSSESAVQAMDAKDRVDAEIALLEDAQKTVALGSDLELLLGEMQSGIYGMLGEMETGHYAGMEDYRAQMLLAANKWQVATGQVAGFASRIARLKAESNSYAAQATPIGAVTAPENGYFVPSAQYDRRGLAYETVAAMTPEQLQRSIARAPEYYSSNVAGHIVTDYKWHFFTVISAKEAEKFTVGDKSLQIAFPEAGGNPLPVTVKSVVLDEDRGIAAVELYCEYMRPEILQLRTEKAEIIFGVKKGLRISKNALRLVDFENADGSKSTYKGVYVKFGNMVYFRKIEILHEDGAYMLVSADVVEDVNEVQMYDDVVVDSGGLELYDRRIL